MTISNSRAVPFTELPDDARIWIFASPEPLSREQSSGLLERVDEFLEEWHAHGHPVVGGRDWRYDRFLVVGADERATGVSGCSTDALFRVFKAAERELGISLLDGSLVWFREGGEIRATTRAEFRRKVQAGEVGPDTIVFDNTARTAGDLRAGRWERPMRESWHAKAFA
ncbi:MAG TPA: hypothetical protein VF167_00920 [Longimicrobiaceae bacterium]